MKKHFIIYIITTLFFSCSNDPASPDDVDGIYSDMTGFEYNIDENLKLTLSAQNFLETISVMSFTLLYNNLTISSIAYGDFTIVFDTETQEVEDDYPSFTFAEVSGTGTLLEVQFSEISNGATISTTNLILFDSSNPPQQKFYENGSFRNIGLCYTDDLSTQNEDIILPEPVWNQGINYCMD